MWVSGLFDALTYIAGANFEYEVNPLYLMTGWIWIPIAVKLLVLIALTNLVIKYEPKKNKTKTWAYMIIFMCVYVILGQMMGGFANLHTDSQIAQYGKEAVVPLEKSDALFIVKWFTILVVYLPMFMGSVTYYIFEKIYLREKTKPDKYFRVKATRNGKEVEVKFKRK